MMTQDALVTTFTLEGRFLGFYLENTNKLKYIKLQTLQGEFIIKLAKNLRSSIVYSLIPGEWLLLTGDKKLDKNNNWQFKAESIKKVNSLHIVPQIKSNLLVLPRREKAKKSTILVCQKSDCCKRGAKAVCAMLEQEISDRGLDEQVKVKGTGCLKRCNSGANIVIDKSRYSRVKPDDVCEILNEHFPETEIIEIEKLPQVA
jgi:(2Fe-2S) ferredoxin